MMICPTCHSFIPNDAIYCPYCGKSTMHSPMDPSLIRLGGTLGTYIASGVQTINSHINTPGSLIIERSNNEFREVWLKLPNNISRAIQEGPRALDNLDTELKRRDRATNITRLIGITNSLFRSKLGTELFREDQPQIISQLYEPCVDHENLPTKVAGLYSLFEVPREPLRRLVLSSNNKGSIKLVQTWLDENAIAYNASMIECWEKIGELRNISPLHAHKPEDIMSILNFFRIGSPDEYEALWDVILDKFLESLIEWHRILREF